jgi:hypothetical protein
MPETVLRPTEPCALEGLEVAGPDCIAEDFGGEIVVLNGASGVYYSLSGLAAGIWRDLTAGHAVEPLLHAIGGVDDSIFQAAGDFIRDLQTEGLLRPRNFHAPTTSPPESVALIRSGETSLTIQSFDDMRDLILADPIHDVEENIGWPVLRPPNNA